MIAIFKKEIYSFFTSTIGYLVIAVFLILNGLILWLLKGQFNIFDNGFADLSSYFYLAPWVLIFLCSAICMQSFSEEKKQGTLELLLTKPITAFSIVMGKYLASFILVVLAILPTILYVYTIFALKNHDGNIDFGSIIGSFFGLLFLVMSYVAIGVFSSLWSTNQIVCFIISVVLCLLFFIGFDSIADLISHHSIESLGIQAHYRSIGRGVLDTKDLIYFLCLAALFILMTIQFLKLDRFNKKQWFRFGIITIAFLLITIFGQYVSKRFDITKDKRYTLSKNTITLIEDANSPVIIDVFLEGNLSPEFKRLRTETKQLLEEFELKNKNIHFNFINALKDNNTREQNLQALIQRGLKPMQTSIQSQGKRSQEVVIPWALASYDGFTVKIPLIKHVIGNSIESMITNSVQNLEYTFADALTKLIRPKQKKIAIIKGNGQLENKNITDFITTLKEYYFIAPFTLDSVQTAPKKALTALLDYDLIISAKPNQSFTEQEKYTLDQYLMNGGKSLWLIDKVAIDTDSLKNPRGENVAVNLDLNLTDFFFKYGIRINPVIVKDMYSAPITLAIGQGSQSQFQPIRWQYSPLTTGGSHKHPIVENLNAVKFNFANPIDTLKTQTVTKTILLQSSELSKTESVPKLINLSEATKEPNPKAFTDGKQILAVLLEGRFTSVYNNRIKPFDWEDNKNQSDSTKMVVIADGDLIKNEIGRQGPLELGFDRLTGRLFGNKEFLLNTVNYLLDDYELLNLRTKDIAIAFLDSKKIEKQKAKWQLINIMIPLIFLSLFGIVFNYIRKQKYSR